MAKGDIRRSGAPLALLAVGALLLLLLPLRASAQDVWPPPSPLLRVASSARALVAVDDPGGALLLDAAVEWSPIEFLFLRAAGAPLALAGGALSGIAAGQLSLVAGLDLSAIVVGVGAGAAVLATRLGDPGTKEVLTLVLHGRLGPLTHFHMEGQLSVASFSDVLDFVSVQLTARLPFRSFAIPLLRNFELLARAAGGHDGVVVGELGAVIWLESSDTRPVLGLSVFAGGAGVFYQPVCRFGAPCLDTRVYAGPHVGVGVEWRVDR